MANDKMIKLISNGLSALRSGSVEPMGLSITPHSGDFGWGFFKFKALPNHPNPGNAGKGWSHPTNLEAIKLSHAPRDWQTGESFPWDWEVTLDEVKEFVKEIAIAVGLPLDFSIECVWRNKDDMTVPGQKGILSDIVILRGGTEHYAYYPDIAQENEDHTKAKQAALMEMEQSATDEYMSSWGGKREGAGRPPSGRKRRSINLSDDEFKKVKVFVDKLREK